MSNESSHMYMLVSIDTDMYTCVKKEGEREVHDEDSGVRTEQRVEY